MSPKLRAVLGVLLVVVGATVALAYPDEDYLVVDGRVLGVVLVLLGLVDLVRARAPRS